MLNEILSRRSIRKYKNQELEEEKILQVIDSARLAPTGSNTQPTHFIVVKSDAMREKIAEVSHKQKWMMTAPVFIVCVADISSRFDNSSELVIDENSPQPEVKQIIRDASIAIDHLVLAAENLCLGTCWVAWFTQQEIRPVLNIPSDKYVVSIITLGYADESPKARPRKSLEDIIHYENW